MTFLREILNVDASTYIPHVAVSSVPISLYMENTLYLQIREYMAKMGFKTFQEMIGRVDKLKFSPMPNNHKAELLNFAPILTNALDVCPDTNIVGGSLPQEFNLHNRIVSLTFTFVTLSCPGRV